MNNELAHSEITRLEERIEELRQALDRCDKLAWAARVAIAGSALWFALVLLSILMFSPAGFAGAMAALLGGFVLAGSNKTTREQTEAALQQAEDRRRALIDSMRLRLVEEPHGTLQ
ncbi:MAG TPA: hypothetical protein VNR39_08440 [Pseudolabrys sp.]|nr:hypothetical protein [Pseudolabrys sp.]